MTPGNGSTSLPQEDDDEGNVDAEDPTTRNHVVTVLSVIQPYAAYKEGHYVYNPCD